MIYLEEHDIIYVGCVPIMGAKKDRLVFYLKYLVPKNNLWLKRAYLLFFFIIFDYISTLAFITSPVEEGNLLVRYFMETYGILLGLTLFDLIINIPIYLIISFNSHFANLPPKMAKITNPLIDVFLAWFVAGYHYSGATSWFWTTSDLIRQLTGFTLYMSAILIVSQISTVHQFLTANKNPTRPEQRIP